MDTYNLMNSVLGSVPRKINLDVVTLVKGIGVYQNNHAYWLMEYTMRRLIPAGIPQHNRKSIFDVKYSYGSDSTDDTQTAVFSLNDLHFCFVVWLVSILITVVTFLLEIIYVYGKMAFKSTIGLFIILKFLRNLPNN